MLFQPSHSIRRLRIFLITLLSVFTLVSTVKAQPSASLQASRLSGPAPLAVFFDATETRHADASLNTFRELGYYFDFDDTGSGVWATSGLSKNREVGGPLAAHVFDRPGEYRVGLRVQDAQGRWSDAWQTITVTDPDSVYAGSNTVVISTGSDFSDAPAGAEQLAHASAWPDFESDKRYLLKSGDDFSALGRIIFNHVSNFQLATFGAGAKPMVSSVYITMDEDRAANPPRHGVVHNLNTQSIRQQMMFHHLLVYGNTVEGDGAGISNAGAVDWYPINRRGQSSYADWEWCRGFFVIDNQVSMNNVHATSARNPIQGGGKWFTVMGNRSTDANEHTLRVFYSYQSLIGHNELTGMNPTGGRHALKMHARGVAPWSDALFPDGDATIRFPRSQYIRIHNNTLGNSQSPNPWTLQLAPQNDSTLEGLQDLLVESNTFIASDATHRDMQTLGNNVIERGNTRSQGVMTMSSYPSNYLNDASWHGPYYIDDLVPQVSRPYREPVLKSPPLPPSDFRVERVGSE